MSHHLVLTRGQVYVGRVWLHATSRSATWRTDAVRSLPGAVHGGSRTAGLQARTFATDLTAEAEEAGSYSGAGSSSGLTRKEVEELLKDLRNTRPAEDDDEAHQEQCARLEKAAPDLQRHLITGELPLRLQLLRRVAELGTIPGRPMPYALYMLIFLEEYAKMIETLRDGETIMDRAQELREVLLCFHRAGLTPERLKLLYSHIERDFPRFEAAGALLPMANAVSLCHTMLATGLSSPGAVVVLLRSASRTPLMEVADDAKELRLLKAIELLIRVDFLYTQEQLPPEVAEYIALVRDLRFYDRELRRDTALSYQMAFFLRKHGFPAKRKMLGPYPLKICDPDERINFEPVEERSWRFGLLEEPPSRKKRHLEAVALGLGEGWLQHPGRACRTTTRRPSSSGSC
ncbi:unnamed protein product [Durusdinium trenchii]|uniref:Uncharacterized protein n=2 Tax=Durusdinium trenchii TaxID=1381693 RepID=A0ABP0RY99_9DINO